MFKLFLNLAGVVIRHEWGREGNQRKESLS